MVAQLWALTLSRSCAVSISALLHVVSYCCAKRLVEVGDDVIAMFDSDAKPDHLGLDTSEALLVDGHLAMRRGRRVTCQRLGIADMRPAIYKEENK